MATMEPSWLPLGQRIAQDLHANLATCPEGTMVATVNSLLALDEAEGDAASLEIVKLLYHLTGDTHPLSQPAGNSPWQQNWLVVAASLLRFMYLKWINVPQNDLSQSIMETNATTSSGAAMLRRHQEFLFSHTISDFMGSGIYNLEMTENSVLFSEAFSFTSFCHLHGVDLVLESGVYKGMSTETWSLFAREVIAMDIFVPPEAERRLQARPNVKLLTGDGRKLLPQLLDAHPSRTVAIFIDGPKGELAIRLALSLRTYPQVAFVAMHDMAPYRQELIRLGAFFFSDTPWFQATYGHLDAPFRMRPDIEAGGTMAFLM